MPSQRSAQASRTFEDSKWQARRPGDAGEPFFSKNMRHPHPVNGIGRGGGAVEISIPGSISHGKDLISGIGHPLPPFRLSGGGGSCGRFVFVLSFSVGAFGLFWEKDSERCGVPDLRAHRCQLRSLNYTLPPQPSTYLFRHL